MAFDKEQQEALAAELEDAGVHVEIRDPEPGTRCARDERYSTSTTLMPTKVVDGEEDVEALGVSWYSDGSDRSRGADASEYRTRIDLTGDHSLVIENVVPNEGMRHRPTFLPVEGAPPACDPVPYDAHWRIDE
ncbi:hypothetical protein [Streptomonospora alba]|nr:hypothetical protein [Streptomonospora alba]